MAAQVLAMPAPQYSHHQMAYGGELLNSYSTLDGLSTGGTGYSSEPSHRSLLMVSPPPVSEAPFRRRSSHSPQIGMNSQIVLERTPIRHHRSSVTRGRSHSRSDLLLAYATEQNQLHQTQSLPSMEAMPSQVGSTIPPIYNMPGYILSPPLSTYSHHGSFFGSPVPPSSAQQESTSEFSLHHNENDAHAYYSIGRTVSHGSGMSLPPPETSSAVYLHGPSQTSQQSLPSIAMTMQPFPPVPLTLESSPAEIEIMPSRPKPQCWDHGCNGRQFSTFSNLLRHQREKSGSAVKATCPHCGTEFTRTTARNGHMSGGKCKGKPDGEDPSDSQIDS